MEQLRHQDLKKLLSTVGELYSIQQLEDFPQHVLYMLRQLIVSDAYFSYTELNSQWKATRTLCEPSEATEYVQKFDSDFDSHVHEHPGIVNFKEIWNEKVIKFSDFFGQSHFHEMGLYNDYYKKTGVEYQITFSIPTFGYNAAFALNRKCRDFTERDRLLLLCLRPHLIGTYRQLSSIMRFRNQIDLCEATAEDDGKGLIFCTLEGRHYRSTPKARQWLKDFFYTHGTSGKSLPPVLSEWVRKQASGEISGGRTTFVATKKGKRLNIVFLKGENQESVLLLTEEVFEPVSSDVLCKSFGLTRREGEVLSWILKGKTSLDIGKILSLSVRTIEKYLEHIYVKLGVENRAAAMAHVFEMVSGRKK